MTEREEARAAIKKRLNSYKDLTDECQQICNELARLEMAMSSPAGPSLDGMPRSPGAGNPVERMVTKYLAIQDKYRTQIARMIEELNRIEDLIEILEPVERRLARFRYIDGLTWEAVCEKMNYSWRQTHRIHGRMLDKLVDAELKRKETPE